MMLSFIFGVVGNATTGLVYLAPMKTFWHVVRKRSTEEFESVPYVLKLLNAYFWTYYGIVKPNSVIVATINGFGVVLMSTYVVIFLLFAPPKMRLRTAVLAATLDVVFPAAAILSSELTLDRETQISTAGLLSSIFSTVAYGSPLAAMKTVVSTKSVEYMPFLLSFILFVNGGVWTVYAILTRDIFVGIPNVTGFCLGALQLILYAMYYKPKKVSTSGLAAGDDLEDGQHQQQVHEPLLTSPTSNPNQEKIDP